MSTKRQGTATTATMQVEKNGRAQESAIGNKLAMGAMRLTSPLMVMAAAGICVATNVLATLNPRKFEDDAMHANKTLANVTRFALTGKMN